MSSPYPPQEKGQPYPPQQPVQQQPGMPQQQQPYPPQQQQPGSPPQQQQPPGYTPQQQQQPGYPPQQQQQPGYPPQQQQQPVQQQPQFQQGQQQVAVQQVVQTAPGLEFLAQVNSLMVCQQIELLEMFTGFETANRYVVKTPQGAQLFFAAEESGCCERQCLGPARPFTLNILSNTNQLLMKADRPFRCTPPLFCCEGLLQAMEITDGTGQPMGRIQQDWGLQPKFSLFDASEAKICEIEGPCCYFPCCEVEFQIKSPDGVTVIGKIFKHFAGIQEFVSSADNFSVQFPMEMPIQHKAVILNAVFLIDFLYFEEKPERQ